MAVLNISKTIEVRSENPVAHMLISNEPDNLVMQLFSKASYIHDVSDKLLLADYDELSFGDDELCMTSSPVSLFGIKNFPKIGAVGFFKTKFTKRNFIIAPLRTNDIKLPPPVLSLTVNESNITVAITNADALDYMYYRILMFQGDFAYEYVACKDTFAVPIPPVNGTYKAVCIGYVDDGASVSLDSNVVSFEVTTGRDDFKPAKKYYTAAEIDVLIASLQGGE